MLNVVISDKIPPSAIKEISIQVPGVKTGSDNFRLQGHKYLKKFVLHISSRVLNFLITHRPSHSNM